MEVSKATPQADLHDVSEVAAELLRVQAGDLIASLTATQKETIRVILAQGVRRGLSDAVLRRRVAQVIGLDPRRALAVQNHRNGLLAGGVPPARAERQTGAYAKRLLRQRVEVLVTHELRVALNNAQRLVWRDMQAMGDYSPWAVRVTKVHKDERACSVCRPQNGRRRSLGRDLTEGPPFHPRCRCEEIVVDQGIEKAITPGGRIGDASSLNRSPKKNWVENAGGLPRYIRMVAHALIRQGKPRDRAIQMAVGIVRNWATHANVSAKVKAAAIKAIAEWEAKKAKGKVSKADQTTWNFEDYQEIVKQLEKDGIK